MGCAITVNVTKTDIKDGDVGHCGRCPVALALQRAFDTKLVRAAHFFLEVGRHKWDTPPEVRMFINRFDNGEGVVPFSFQLQVSAPQ